MSRRAAYSWLGVAAPIVLALAAGPVWADDPAATSAPASAQADAASAPGSVAEIVVTAARLDAARDTIQPQVGASTYSLSQQAIDTLPAGENTPLNQVLLQAPDVTQDHFWSEADL
jgi:outer membrane cobalamin receptor